MINSNLSYLLKCPDYSSYLDHYVKANDFCYLRNNVACRMLVTLGYRSTSEIISQSQFYKLRSQVMESLSPIKKSYTIYSMYMTSVDPVLKALAQRELPNQQKILSTIIFLKFRNPSGFEVSSFIDYQDSLRRANEDEHGATNWVKVFNGEIRLRPKKSDLSYYDWYRNTVIYNNSDNYIVNHDKDYGLMFMYRGDHRKIAVYLSNNVLKRNCKYSMAYSKKYGEVVFIDHVIRKKI